MKTDLLNSTLEQDGTYTTSNR